MALIKCPDCGKEISDTASTCIHCGYSLKNNYIRRDDELARKLDGEKKQYNSYSNRCLVAGLICLGVAFASGMLLIAFLIALLVVSLGFSMLFAILFLCVLYPIYRTKYNNRVNFISRYKTMYPDYKE